MSLTVFCMDLPADEQMGNLTCFFRLEIGIKGAWNHPGGNGSNAYALPGGNQYISACGEIGIVGHYHFVGIIGRDFKQKPPTDIRASALPLAVEFL